MILGRFLFFIYFFILLKYLDFLYATIRCKRIRGGRTYHSIELNICASGESEFRINVLLPFIEIFAASSDLTKV